MISKEKQKTTDKQNIKQDLNTAKAHITYLFSLSVIFLNGTVLEFLVAAAFNKIKFTPSFRQRDDLYAKK